MRKDVDVRRVVGLEMGQHIIDQRLFCLLFGREGLCHQVAYAVAHHLPILFPRVQGEPPHSHRMVHGLTEVVNSIQQSSVQIKKENLAHLFPHYIYLVA